MIGCPAIVAAIVAAAFGHFVLAAVLGVFGVAELLLWQPPKSAGSDSATVSEGRSVAESGPVFGLLNPSPRETRGPK